MPATNRSRRNLILVTIILFAFILAVTLRVGYVQIVKGQEYSERALSQQTTDTSIEAERGIIYDRNQEKLAQSVKCYTILVYPAEIGKYDSKKKQRIMQIATADGLAETLNLDKEETRKKLVGKSGEVIIAKNIDKWDSVNCSDYFSNYSCNRKNGSLDNKRLICVFFILCHNNSI